MDAVVLEAAVVPAHMGLPAREGGAWAQRPGACWGYPAKRGKVGLTAGPSGSGRTQAARLPPSSLLQPPPPDSSPGLLVTTLRPLQ